MRPQSSYWEILLPLLLIGLGSGTSFVSLMSASLADVAPEDAGAASGLVNTSQQLGAAVGLAVLITVFGALTHHGRVGPQQVVGYVHALDDVFGLAAAFAMAALVLIVVFVRTRTSPARADAEVEVLALAREAGETSIEEAGAMAKAGGTGSPTAARRRLASEKIRAA